MTKPLVIYHADCTDGFGAAFAAWLKLGDGAEYLPMQYNTGNPKYEQVKDREVFILDFSFPRSQMDAIFKCAKRVVWLDHHKSAFEIYGQDPDRIYETTLIPNNHLCRLNPNKSGALLAWEYFHPGTEVPMLIQHIDDRDRWQWKLEGSKELHAALASMKPWSFEQWEELFLAKTPELMNHKCQVLRISGAAILRAQNAHVASMVKQARKCDIYFRDFDAVPSQTSENESIKHFDGLALNTPMHISEVGHELANQSGTFGLVWYLDAAGRAKCSLRSNGSYDVSAIARAFGGGGHQNAAGFETDIEKLMGWLK